MVADTLRGSPKRRNLLDTFVKKQTLSSSHRQFSSEALLLLNCSTVKFTLIFEMSNKNIFFIFNMQNTVAFCCHSIGTIFKVHTGDMA